MTECKGLGRHTCSHPPLNDLTPLALTRYRVKVLPLRGSGVKPHGFGKTLKHLYSCRVASSYSYPHLPLQTPSGFDKDENYFFSGWLLTRLLHFCFLPVPLTF